MVWIFGEWSGVDMEVTFHIPPRQNVMVHIFVTYFLGLKFRRQNYDYFSQLFR